MDARHAGDERGPEIVEGILTVAPGEYSTNIAAVWNVGARIEDSTRRAFRCLPNLDVLVRADPAAPTVRCPNAVIVAAGLPRTDRARPDQIVLVVEAVSETSSERDRLTKRAEYAAAGIPAYLVLDGRPGSERIVLFVTGTDGRYVQAPGGRQQRHAHARCKRPPPLPRRPPGVSGHIRARVAADAAPAAAVS